VIEGTGRRGAQHRRPSRRLPVRVDTGPARPCWALAPASRRGPGRPGSAGARKGQLEPGVRDSDAGPREPPESLGRLRVVTTASDSESESPRAGRDSDEPEAPSPLAAGPGPGPRVGGGVRLGVVRLGASERCEHRDWQPARARDPEWESTDRPMPQSQAGGVTVSSPTRTLPNLNRAARASWHGPGPDSYPTRIRS
jgi:hypothetical protein